MSGLPNNRERSYRAAYSRNISSRGDTSELLGYDENQTVTLGQLKRDYHVRLQEVYSDQSGQFSVMDTRMPSVSNVFCSILAEAIPTILVSSGILRLDFRFRSNYRNGRDSVEPYTYGIDFVSTVVPTHPDVAKKQALTVIGELNRGLFQTMYQTRRDFWLTASVDLTGLTFLKLHFLCDDQVYQEPYEHPTIFTGLVTNQFGNPVNAQHNANQMAKFVTAVTNDDSDYNGRDLILPGDTVTTNSDGYGFPDLAL